MRSILLLVLDVLQMQTQSPSDWMPMVVWICINLSCYLGRDLFFQIWNKRGRLVSPCGCNIQHFPNIATIVLCFMCQRTYLNAPGWCNLGPTWTGNVPPKKKAPMDWSRNLWSVIWVKYNASPQAKAIIQDIVFVLAHDVILSSSSKSYAISPKST